jgi:RNA polymerase sigma-70 factor (ECF subfamily)
MSEPNNAASAGSTEDGWFKTTHWSVVLAAGEGDSAGAAALNRLCQTYWHPLYTYVRRLGQSPADAQDLTQGFFARLLEKDYLKSVDPARGKFRSFLILALKRFLANEWDHANCHKRGGGQQVISLDAVDTENRYLAEPMDGMTPERAFDRRWALTLLDEVMAHLETEFAADDKAEVFAELKGFLSGDQDQSYTTIAQRLAVTEGALRVIVHRLRRRFRELLRLEIAHTVGSPDEVDDELRHVLLSLS